MIENLRRLRVRKREGIDERGKDFQKSKDI